MSATTATWKQWSSRFKVAPDADRDAADLLHLPDSVAQQIWQPSEQDQGAAWDLYTELRTRITVQPLHYLHVDEGTVLYCVAELHRRISFGLRSAGGGAAIGQDKNL